MSFFDDDGNLFSFKKPREELSIKYRYNHECNLCLLRSIFFNYNNENTSNTYDNWITKSIHEPESEDENSYQSSEDYKNNQSSKDDKNNQSSEDDTNNQSGEETDSSVSNDDYYFYTDDEEVDICFDCIYRYPMAEDLTSAIIFYFSIYDYSHYYPNFPEMKYRIQIDPNKLNIHHLSYQGYKLLSMIPGHNSMLELMDFFKLSLNQILEIFIDHIDDRQNNFRSLGLGTKLLSPPVVIYKFFEKFIRYTVRRRLRFDDENSKWSDDQIWKIKDVNLNLIDKIAKENMEDVEEYFLDSFSYVTSIDVQTRRLLRKFLDLYDQTSYLSYQYQPNAGIDRLYESLNDDPYLWALNQYYLSLGPPVMSSVLQDELILAAEEMSLRPGNWRYIDAQNSFYHKQK